MDICSTSPSGRFLTTSSEVTDERGVTVHQLDVSADRDFDGEPAVWLESATRADRRRSTRKSCGASSAIANKTHRTCLNRLRYPRGQRTWQCGQFAPSPGQEMISDTAAA
jgi:hypothetical protein